MYSTCLETAADTTVTIASGGRRTTVDLYTREGLEAVAGLWLKLSAEFRLMYDLTWLGVPIIQLPGDIVMMQELIWRIRPEAIVECGFAHGGSAIFYASILELAGKGEVIGVDVEVRKYNRLAVESHPMAHRIRIVEGSSIDPSTVARIEETLLGAAPVIAVLDSNHTTAHVLEEMELYAPLVTPGSYLVVMDGAQAHVWDTPRGKREWRDDNPLEAIARFLERHPEFEEDSRYTRTEVTSSPRGFLRRRRREEMARPFAPARRLEPTLEKEAIR
ncbi:MAG: CmcI family methyltransferase [Bryobacteraceae bacterium]